MDYEQLRQAVAPAGGRVVGFVAAVLPEGEPDEVIDGFAVAVMIPGRNPRWWITQYGSAPRGDMEKLRRAIAEKIGQPPARKRGPISLLRSLLGRFQK